MADKLNMHAPCSPGELIQEDYLKPYNISGRELATRLKVAPSTVSRLLKSEIGLSADMALRLSVVLGGSPGSWMNIQKNYSLWQAEQSFSPEGLVRINFETLERIENNMADVDGLAELTV